MTVRVKRLFGLFGDYVRYALILSVFVFILTSLAATPVMAMTNPTINFQGRLLNSQGAVVPDGYYNVQFKIYQDGDGLSANDATGAPAGTLKWTENWTNNGGHAVTVKNGYMSVELGTVNPFGAQVDWDQSVLWLSVNVGNTNATCTPITSCALDGEMLPMKRFSSIPYAMNSGMLGGLTAAGFIQNTTTLQAANIAVQSAAAGSVAAVISGAASQSVDIFQVKSTAAVNPLFAIGSTGAITVQPASDSTSTFVVKTSNGAGGNSVLTVDSQNSRVTVGNAGTTGTGLTAYGAVSSTTGYQISGANLLTGTALTFTGAAGATIQSAQNQTLSIQGGSASVAGTNGANLSLAGGAGSGSGAQGLVVMTTPTFTTTTADPNCFTSGAPVAGTANGAGTGIPGCTLAQTSVDGTSAILVGFNADGKYAVLPAPTIGTAGRVIYVTASSGSNDFTLRVNGGGQGNDIAMRKNTTATMIWNGSAWTAAGASSSTTLQASYDNTLQSAGGAELVVTKTSATNGLTIRDSSDPTKMVNGTLLSVQTASAAGLLQVNSNVTEYASDAGAEAYGASNTTFPANTWSAISSATVTRQATTGNYVASGQGSVSVQTTAGANSGVVNTLVNSSGTPTALIANNHYNVSFAARLDSAYSNFTTLNVYYSINGSTQSVPCAAGQTVPTSIWTKINCNFTAPASGITSTNAILIQQSDATARKFYIDNLSVTIAADYNLATDGSADDNTNFGTNWTTVSAASIARSTTYGNDASDSAQVGTTSAGQGVRNKLAINPLASTLYRVTVYAASSTAFTDFTVRYSRDGGTSFVPCADYNTQNISTNLTSFTKVTCYISTDSTGASNPYIYFTQAGANTRTFYVDTFSMTLSSSSTPNVQIGGGTNGGPTTLFTLDKGASAPIAANNDALLGSMYYDTTLGKLQCYEADGWGACGSSPDNIITISPEYTNAVLHGPSGGTTGIGTMTSDICSDYLNINDGSSGQPTICGANETYNFYRWTTPQSTQQTYAIYLTYQLPTTFKSFNSGQTSLMARTDNGASGTSANVSYKVYRNSGSGLSPCGSSTVVSTGTVASWQTKTASGAADPSTCSFAAGNSIVFEIDVTADRNGSAYVGNLNFAFSNK